MIPALRWAAMRAILMFHWLWGTKSQDSVHRPQPLKRKVSRSGFEPRSLCLPALPLGQTGSHHLWWWCGALRPQMSSWLWTEQKTPWNVLSFCFCLMSSDAKNILGTNLETLGAQFITKTTQHGPVLVRNWTKFISPPSPTPLPFLTSYFISWSLYWSASGPSPSPPLPSPLFSSYFTSDAISQIVPSMLSSIWGH